MPTDHVDYFITIFVNETVGQYVGNTNAVGAVRLCHTAAAYPPNLWNVHTTTLANAERTTSESQGGVIDSQIWSVKTSISVNRRCTWRQLLRKNQLAQHAIGIINSQIWSVKNIHQCGHLYRRCALRQLLRKLSWLNLQLVISLNRENVTST